MKKTLSSLILAVTSIGISSAATLSFQVAPATYDTSPADGFITGTEFSPTGDDGTGFVFLPTNNLVGANRMFLSLANGFHFGGGGGSTLSFEFTPDQPIQLNSYTLSSSGSFLGNPVWDIREGATVLSSSNTANPTGATLGFAGGPLLLDGGTTYSFFATATGAAVQAYMASWDYTTVPEPSSAILITLGTCLFLRRSRK